MNDQSKPEPGVVDPDKEVSFTYPDGMIEAAAMLDFLADEEEKLAFLKALSRTLQ